MTQALRGVEVSTRKVAKQAIQEGFILDVLAHYTPVASYYKLAKTVEDDPESMSTRRGRSCGASSRATTTRSASRPRS